MKIHPYPKTSPVVDFTAAALISAAGLVLVFLAAFWTREWALFSLVPPSGGAPDVLPGQREDLHRTFFTVWVSMALAAPAIALFPFAGDSPWAARMWRILWTSSMLVFAVHFYWAIMVIFDGDWARVLNTSRVTAPRLDTVFAIWWVLDVLLAWTLRSTTMWVRLQRIGVHVLATVLFFMGAAREGELPVSRTLGWIFTVAVVAGLVAAIIRHRRSVARRQAIAAS